MEEEDEAQRGDTEYLTWWDEDEERWLTHFPPPDDFVGHEQFRRDHAEYCRTLTPAELEAMGPGPDYHAPVVLAALTEAREGYFARAAARRAMPLGADSLFSAGAPT